MASTADRPARGADRTGLRCALRTRRAQALAAAGLAWSLLLAGCARDDAPPAVVPAATPAVTAVAQDDAAALVLPDVMDWVVDPAAAVLAAAADQHGWAGLSPRSDEAWQAVVDAATELVRTTDLLVQPGLARGRDGWLEAAGVMRDGALSAAAAARRHDPRGLYLAGQQVRAGCQGCHARHAPALAPPLAVPPARS